MVDHTQVVILSPTLAGNTRIQTNNTDKQVDNECRCKCTIVVGGVDREEWAHTQRHTEPGLHDEPDIRGTQVGSRGGVMW